MKNSPLTAEYEPVLATQISKTRSGMAHFAATGPFGATCGDCAFLGYWQPIRNQAGDVVRTVHRRGCGKFLKLTGKPGPTVPATTEACRYFERWDDACTCATCTSQDTTSDG